MAGHSEIQVLAERVAEARVALTDGELHLPGGGTSAAVTRSGGGTTLPPREPDLGDLPVTALYVEHEALDVAPTLFGSRAGSEVGLFNLGAARQENEDQTSAEGKRLVIVLELLELLLYAPKS